MATATDIDLALVSRLTLTATLRVKTGLHIGAGKDSIEIGGIDNPVVKTPDGDPYVPGSSIKGRLRFLLEWAFNTIASDGKPWGMDPRARYDAADPVLRLFGTPAKREQWSAGPTRLLVRDAMPMAHWRDGLLGKGLALTESKTEVLIDRVAGKAHDGVGPRHTERVPPGAAFGFEAVCRLYRVGGDEARDRDCIAWAIQGLDLIEQDALGGSGSRGYGRVAFEDIMLKGPSGRSVRLDGNEFNFRNHAFSRDKPPAPLRAAVDEALGA